MKTITNIVFSFLFLFSITAFAQSSVSGKVNDENGIPISGATVVVDGTSTGTVTDMDGAYSLSGLAGEQVSLTASYLGFKTQSQTVSLSGMNVTADFVLAEDFSTLDEIIITGVVNPKSKLESSVSISTLGVGAIEQAAPRSAGELFRNIPGIRAESSGGEGNANFNVRGVPVSSGGSRYFQIQEDGLPLNLFGDTSFGNSDNFLRIDSNIGRVEAIRGGSASTQTSNGPAGIINMISKTGDVEGGAIMATYGLDYQTSRMDFEYGTPLGNGLSYHIGGFMRTGEGPRNIGYQGNKGGQIKANITKKFESGYVRTYFKYLNDKSVMYLPMPMLLKGSNDNPSFENLPGFDINNDSPHSANMQQSAGTDPFTGDRNVNDVRNGNNPKSQAIGTEFSFDLGNDWNVTGKARYSANSGEWVSPFTMAVGTVSEIETTARDAVSATGALVYADDNTKAFAPSNGLAQIIHMFDVTIDDLSNFFSDVKVNKKVSDNLGLTVGMFTATQNTKIGWQWSSFISEVQGNGEARLADFEGWSRNGQYSYGTPTWGNCCQRKYNTVHNVNSPYVAVDANLSENLNFDGSVRFENVRVNGNIQAGPTSQGSYDYDGDGTIQGIEQVVPVIAGNAGQNISDEYNFVSYSFGLNLKTSDDAAVFLRTSLGASGRAPDRNSYGSNGRGDTQYDEVSQTELGYKKRFDNGFLNLTGFMSNTKEGLSNELNRTVGNPFKALGIEAESSLVLSDKFSLVGSATWTKAEIDGGDNKGNTPRRQADFVYNFTPTYMYGNDNKNTLGLSILGTSKSYAQDDNALVMPGYAYVNLFSEIKLTNALSLWVNVNNLFDAVGITEVEGNGDGAFNGDRLARARSISGRSSTVSLQFNF